MGLRRRVRGGGLDAEGIGRTWAAGAIQRHLEAHLVDGHRLVEIRVLLPYTPGRAEGDLRQAGPETVQKHLRQCFAK